MNYYRQLLDYICNITPHECTNTSAKVHSPNILVQKNMDAPIHFSQGNHPPLALGPPYSQSASRRAEGVYASRPPTRVDVHPAHTGLFH